jgi:hypothetical protein
MDLINTERGYGWKLIRGGVIEFKIGGTLWQK